MSNLSKLCQFKDGLGWTHVRSNMGQMKHGLAQTQVSSLKLCQTQDGSG